MGLYAHFPEKEKMTDIHNHLMPHIDDGAGSIEESAAMLDLAYKRGTKRIVLTPHFQHYYFKENENIKAFYDSERSFMRKAKELNPNIELYTGAEVFVDNSLLRYAEETRLPTINGGRYILTEYGEDTDFEFIIYAVALLKAFGYLPIVAHTDRYYCLKERKRRIDLLKKVGAVIQVNANSITGNDGLAHGELTEYLLEKRKIDVVASDAHSLIGRTPDLSEAAAEISAISGEDYSNKLLRENPFKIIVNTDLGEDNNETV